MTTKFCRAPHGMDMHCSASVADFSCRHGTAEAAAATDAVCPRQAISTTAVFMHCGGTSTA